MYYLVYIYATHEDDDFKRKIYELLRANSIHSAHLMVEGLNEEFHKHTLLASCKWVVILHEKSKPKKTLMDRLISCRKYRKSHEKETRILVCSSKLVYSEIEKYLDSQSDLIHPDNCNIELLEKIKGNN